MAPPRAAGIRTSKSSTKIDLGSIEYTTMKSLEVVS